MGLEISSSFNKLANKILDKTPANKLNIITADAFNMIILNLVRMI